MVIYEYVHYLKVVIFWLNSKGYPIFLDLEGNVARTTGYTHLSELFFKYLCSVYYLNFEHVKEFVTQPNN
jgi:hypothetical protein